MAENIVSSMFGLTPPQVQQQQQSQERDLSIQYAQMTPFERANSSMYQAGSQLTGAGLGLMGMQDPQMQAAKQAESLQKQIDHSTPEGLMQGAAMFNQAGNPRMAFMYQQAANAKAQELANINRIKAQEELYRAQAVKAGKEEDLTKYGRLQKIEVGVEGKPDYRQQVLYDPIDGTTKNIGAPYRIPASISAEGRAAAAEKKTEAADEKAAKGKQTVNSLTGMLRSYYDNLDKLGAIVSTKRGSVENAKAQMMLSGAGQTVAGGVGTEAQKFVNQIASTRPLLLNAIKEATGMTAKQMDSNVELQMYLKAATDPKLGYEANMEALNNLNTLYGIGISTQDQPQPKQNDLAAAAKAELERRRKGK